MRLITTLLLMAVAVPVWADWVKFGDFGELATFYYDPTTIKKQGDTAYVWVYTELEVPLIEVESQKEVERSSRAVKEIDCKHWQWRTLRRTSFSGPMMSGEIFGEYGVGKWKDGSDSTLLKIICK